jgi:hypothetical protein
MRSVDCINGTSGLSAGALLGWRTYDGLTRSQLRVADDTLGTADAVTGLLGSISRANLFNPPNWIHWIHLGSGLFVLAVAVTSNHKLQIGLALFAAVAGTTLGLGGLASVLYTVAHSGMQELDVSDPLAHLAVGTLAIWALRNVKSRASV